MNDGQHCRHFSFLPSPDFHIQASPSMTLTPSSSLERSVLAHRALVFPVTSEDPGLGWLLAEFRLLVNESIRIALREDIRSRARLTRAAYADLSARHAVHKQYIPSAFEVALAILKVHRRRIRKGKRSSTPFLRRLMLKAENQSYWLDRETGRIRIPIRGTEGVQLHLPLSEWHRSILGDSSWGLGSLTVVPGKVIVVLRKEAPKPYEPQGAGDRLGHERRFPRWGSGIGRFGGPASRIVRPRASDSRYPMPTPTETRPPEGPLKEGRPAAS